MPGFENHTGFTITPSRLQMVELTGKGGSCYIENIDEAWFNEPLNPEKEKETKISALLQGALNEILLKKPLISNNVSFTLPFELFNLFQVPYDNTLLHNDLLEEFKWELSVLYPWLNPEEQVINYIELAKNSFITHNSALVVALQRRFMTLLYNFTKENNLKLKFVDNSHFASERGLSAIYPVNEEPLVLSLYISNKFLSIIFSSFGKPFYFKLLPINDAGEIPNLLKKELTPKDWCRVNKKHITMSFVTGEDISESFVSSLSSMLELNFIYFNPFDKLRPVSSLIENRLYIEKFNSFAPAAGIALRVA
jgi:hypothetical protein